MKRNPYYQLQYMAGIPYLVSFGQAHADFRQDVQLNDTGVFLWNCIEKFSTEEELLNYCAAEFAVREEEKEIVAVQVREFLALLYRKGLLLRESEDECCSCTGKTVEIAGLFCRLHGSEEMFKDTFVGFETTVIPEGELVQNIYVRLGTPVCRENGKVLLRNRELMVLKNVDRYVLLFPTMENLKEVWLDLDGHSATIYCKKLYDEQIAEQLFYAVRVVFLYWAQKRGMVAIHSASVLYQDKLWLFSGPSGTGKSTHTGMWHQLQNVPIINGDLNLIEVRGETPMVHGIPWCGTSGICSKTSYPLGGIVLLRQSEENVVRELPEEQKQLLVLHRCISPFWEDELLQKNCDIVQKMCQSSMICRLECTPEPAAVECIREYIDKQAD